MSNQNQAIQKTNAANERAVEFIPFGSDEKIRLTVQMVLNILCTQTKSGKVATEQEAMKFMMLCKARGLNPFEGDAYLVGYDAKDGPKFSLITAHQAFLKRAELHPEYDGMDSGVIVQDEHGQLVERQGDFYLDDETILGAWAKVSFKNRKIPMVKRLRLSTFRKPFGVWESNPEGMIVKCAEADALRASFPTKLGGLYMAEEQPWYAGDPVANAKPVGANGSNLLPEPPSEDAKPEPKRQRQDFTLDPEPKPSNPRTELLDLAHAAGCGLNDIVFLAQDYELIPKGAAVETVDDIPDAVVDALLKNKGLKKTLEGMKGAK